MNLFLILFVISFWLIYRLIKKNYNFWIDHGFQSAVPSFPFGNLSGVGSTITNAERIQSIYKKFKGKNGAVGIFFFFKPVLLPIDLNLIRDILIKEFSSFHDRGFYFNKRDDPMSANMLTLEGQEWRDVRTKLSPIFTSGKMKMMFEIVNQIGDRFITAFEKVTRLDNEIEVGDWVARFTSDVIGNIAFGINCNCLENADSDFLKYGRRVFELKPFDIMKFFLTTLSPEFARKMKITLEPAEATEFFKEIFLTTIAEREKGNFIRNDFVQLLLQMKTEAEGKQFTNIELAAESFIFYVGGFETSSTLMTFCLYELALNPDIQNKLRDEIKSYIEENEGQLSYNILFEMKYLDMVINETLRKYPPIPTTARKCTKEYELPGSDLTLPVGTLVEIPMYAIHRDPEYYPNPDKFDPERFTEENIKMRPQYSFLPFGEGPRNCIGSRFAYMQSKIGIVKLIQNFEFSVLTKTCIPIKFQPKNPFLAPDGGMWLNVVKIDF